MKASLRPTGERVQLPGQRGHHHVVLHDVGHLVLEVLLVERDQGVGAGVPNLKEKHSLCLQSVNVSHESNKHTKKKGQRFIHGFRLKCPAVNATLLWPQR